MRLLGVPLCLDSRYEESSVCFGCGLVHEQPAPRLATGPAAIDSR